MLNHSRALYRPLNLDERTGLSSSLLSLKFRSPFFRCCIFHDQDFQLVHSGTVVFAARCYLPQKYFTIRRAFRQHKLTLETQGDAAAARKRSHQWCVYPECTMTSCWMAPLGSVFMACCIGNCGYQTDRKIYDQSASHSACDPFVICAYKIINSLLLAAARIIRAMVYAFLFVLAIAALWLIMKLSCFFIELVFIWIYTFISFGFWLIFFLLRIVCSPFVGFLACVLITFAVVSVWLNPNGSRTGEYIRAISVSCMVAYLYF